MKRATGHYKVDSLSRWDKFKIWTLIPIGFSLCFLDNIFAKRGLKDSWKRAKGGYWGGNNGY